MDRRSHEEMSREMFGGNFAEVHQWIDACFKEYLSYGKNAHYGSPYFHWRERHNLRAIKERFGKCSKEYEVAKLHILADWIAHWGEVHMPNDAKEVDFLLKLKLGKLMRRIARE